LVEGREGELFDVTLNQVREELRRVQEEHSVPQLKLKDFRHTRVSHLKAAGWSDVKIRDQYTKHKHLSTLQDKYMSYVPEDITEEDLWRVLPQSSGDGEEEDSTNDVIDSVVEKYGL
jgi:integrase